MTTYSSGDILVSEYFKLKERHRAFKKKARVDDKCHDNLHIQVERLGVALKEAEKEIEQKIKNEEDLEEAIKGFEATITLLNQSNASFKGINQEVFDLRKEKTSLAEKLTIRDTLLKNQADSLTAYRADMKSQRKVIDQKTAEIQNLKEEFDQRSQKYIDEIESIKERHLMNNTRMNEIIELKSGRIRELSKENAKLLEQIDEDTKRWNNISHAQKQTIQRFSKEVAELKSQIP